MGQDPEFGSWTFDADAVGDEDLMIAVREALDGIEAGSPGTKAAFFHEFIAEIPRAEEVQARLLAKGFLAGLHLQPIYRDRKDFVLLCCTERNSPADLDAFVAALAECMTP